MTRSQTTPLKLTLPFWRYGEMFGPDSSAFLLDSAMDPDRLGRYSFLGGNPSALLTARRIAGPNLSMALTLTTWRQPDGTRLDTPLVRNWSGDPFTALRNLQLDYQPVMSEKRPPGGPFQSGLIGYFGYETGYAIEHLPDTGMDDLQLPDLAFMVVDEVLCHDHSTGETTLSIIDRGDADSVLQDWRARLATFEADTDVRSTGWHTPAFRGRRPPPSMATAGSASGSLRHPGSGALQTPRESGGMPSGAPDVRVRFESGQACAPILKNRIGISAVDNR